MQAGRTIRKPVTDELPLFGPAPAATVMKPAPGREAGHRVAVLNEIVGAMRKIHETLQALTPQGKPGAAAGTITLEEAYTRSGWCCGQ